MWGSLLLRTLEEAHSQSITHSIQRENKRHGDGMVSVSTQDWLTPTRNEIRNMIAPLWAQHLDSSVPIPLALGTVLPRLHGSGHSVWTAQSQSPSPSGLSSRGTSRSLKWKLAIMSRTANISLFKP